MAGVDGKRRWVGGDAGAVRLFGGVEHGYWEDGLLDATKPKSEWQHELQKRVENVAWVKAISGRVHPKMWAGVVSHLRRGPPTIAKVFADNVGEGGEFIVSTPMAELERTAELARSLESLVADLPMSASTITNPFLTTGAQPFLHGIPATGDMNPADLPKSMLVSGERNLTAKTLTVSIPADRDAIEDSIIDFVDLGRQLVAEALRDGTEDAMINGDTTVPHGDTAFASWNPRSRWQVLGSSLDHRRAWIGWRHRAIDTSAHHDYTGSQTVVGALGAIGRLTVPHSFGDVVYITSPEYYLAKILTDTNLLTYDKYGDLATLVTGEVGKIGGRRIVLSEFMTADLAASGLYTGTGAKTGMVVPNLSRFRMGRRRALRIEVETVVRNHTTYIVASERKALHTFDGSSVKNVAYLYNLDSTVA